MINKFKLVFQRTYPKPSGYLLCLIISQLHLTIPIIMSLISSRSCVHFGFCLHNVESRLTICHCFSSLIIKRLLICISARLIVYKSVAYSILILDSCLISDTVTELPKPRPLITIMQSATAAAHPTAATSHSCSSFQRATRAHHSQHSGLSHSLCLPGGNCLCF